MRSAVLLAIMVVTMAPVARANSALANGRARPGIASKGEFIFFHNSLIGEDSHRGADQGWRRLLKFRVLLTNGYVTFGPDRASELHRHGCRLFFYFWFSGFYEWEAKQPMPDGDWRRETLESHRDWLLNPDQPEQGGGAVQPAYFFDLSQASLRQFLARTIAAHRQRTGYDGVFFDYAGSHALPAAVLKRFQQRHPDVGYDAAGAAFLREVRGTDPKVLIFTNQAHWAAEHLLPLTDIDVSESIATSYLWGKEITVFPETGGLVKTRETFYRSWDGPNGIKAHYDDLLAKRHRFNPNVHFVTINYVRASWEPTKQRASHEGKSRTVYRRRPDRAAVFYGYVAAKLFGLDSYSSDWYDLGCYDDEVFLTDLGQPQGPGPEERDGIVIRYCDRGLVVLTTTPRGGQFDVSSARIPSDVGKLWDVYERRAAASRKRCLVTIKPVVYATSGSTYPSGRVYLYVR